MESSTQSSIESLVKFQADLHKRVQNSRTNYRKDGPNRRTKYYIESRMKRLEEFYDEFQANHKIIYAADLPTTHNYITEECCDQFEELFLETLAFFQSELEIHFPAAPSSTSIPPNTPLNIQNASNQNGNEICVRLPKIPLPTFTGKYIDWPPFYDSFKRLVHTNANLADIEKFHHLKQSLPANFDSDIRDLALTDANYKIAYETLVKRYDNKRVLFTHYMNLISNQPIITSENSNQIKHLLDTSRSGINALRQLQLPIDGCDQILVHFLIPKLPRETHQLWEQKLGQSTDIPNFEQFTEFLEIRFRTLEAIEYKSHVASTNTPTSANKSSSANHNRHHSNQNRSSKSINSTIQNDNDSKNSKVVNCVLCSEAHIIRHCNKFLNLDCFERKAIVDKNKLCSNCLSGTHTFAKCTSLKNCQQCGKRHHTLLHFPLSSSNVSKSNDIPNAVNSQNTKIHSNVINDNVNISNNISINSLLEVLLPTAIIKVYSSDGRIILLRAFLDQGSQGALITERASQLLRCNRIPSLSNLSFPLGQQGTGKYVTKLTIQSCINENFKLDVVACIVKKTTNDLPTQSFKRDNWSHLKNISLADPQFDKSRAIDILLGADVLGKILLPGLVKGNSNEPIAQQTEFGWIVSGEVFQLKSSQRQFQCSHISLENLVQSFYELERVPEENKITSEEKWCEEHFQKTHKRQTNGRYLVRLPLKTLFDPTKTIGKSRQLALNRFYSLECKLNRNPEMKKQYFQTMEEYFQLNQIQPVYTNENQHCQLSETSPNFNCFTLPHHAVIKMDRSTTKCRVVFDASAKSSNGNSLNDISCIGPKLQNDLPAILMNWRLHRYVFTADVEKMYRCINMHEDDSQYQRTFWYDKNGKIKEFRLTTVTFGTASAPFIANRVIHQLADDERERFPLAYPVLKREIYIDDVFSGSQNVSDTIDLRNQVMGALASAGFVLRKWASNSVEILESIPKGNRIVNPSLPISDNNQIIKTLGMHWNPSSDKFEYKLNFDINSDIITKRIVLSAIARLYDPMGLIGPVIIKAKIFLKKVWTKSLEWDEELPRELSVEWHNYLMELSNIGNIQIPRWLHSSSNVIGKYEIHAFCDGSKDAYASTVYLRFQTSNDQFHSNIIIAKNKVTPSKPTLCIPRIELCAAVLSVQLVQWVLNQIKLNTDEIKIFYWTDATIVLSWIRGDINRWPVFVANRINKIHSLSSAEQWHHISTEENPADCLSRGLSPIQLSNHQLYWHGPKWLVKHQNAWPKSEWTFLEPESKQINCITSSETTFIQKYSSFTNLCRVTAFILRFIHNCRSKIINNHRNGNLTVIEINNALFTLIKVIQLECFKKEIQAIKAKQNISSKSKLISLSPFLDNNNILRVWGRLHRAPLPYDQRHPMILPSSHHFTKLLIEFGHLSTLHGGPQLTASFIRQRFWILHARKYIRLQIKKCIKCFKSNPEISTQQMGNLPAVRLTPSKPFTSTGIDYTGAIELRASRFRGTTHYKGYICIFICLATKAIHLEAVTGMDTQSFLATLDRFIGRRGKPHDIYSDCGTNFMGADKVLKQNAKRFQIQFNNDIVSNLANQGIQWHFNPPHSPNFGGIWEANVKSTKNHLKRMCDGMIMTYEELSTVLSRIESCLNSRPLCALTADPDDVQALTPGHFLRGDSMLAPPEPMIDSKLSLRQRYLQLQRMHQQFWLRWSSDWLSHLQSRPKWHQPTENLKLNDLVIIKEDNLPSNQWLLGRIIELHPGSDNLVRVVTIKTKNGIYKRSRSKVCRLPIENNSE